MLLRYAYTIFLGVILATFVGVGIAAFYPSPKTPEPDFMTTPKTYPAENATDAAKLEAESIRNQKEWRTYDEKRKEYSRDVSTVSIGFAVLLLVVSLLLANKLFIISDGVMLGSLFTLMYSIIRGFESQDEKFRFIVVLVGLLIALFVGYIKFVKQIPLKTKK